MIPAIVLISIRDPNKGLIFGDAAVSRGRSNGLEFTLSCLALVLDRRGLESRSTVLLLHPHLGLHPLVNRHLRRRWIPCLPPS